MWGWRECARARHRRRWLHNTVHAANAPDGGAVPQSCKDPQGRKAAARSYFLSLTAARCSASCSFRLTLTGSPPRCAQRWAPVHPSQQPRPGLGEELTHDEDNAVVTAVTTASSEASACRDVHIHTHHAQPSPSRAPAWPPGRQVGAERPAPPPPPPSASSGSAFHAQLRARSP